MCFPHLSVQWTHSNCFVYFLQPGKLTFAPDNRGVFDDGEAQELTEVDIVEMKGQGVKGQVGSSSGDHTMYHYSYL